MTTAAHIAASPGVPPKLDRSAAKVTSIEGEAPSIDGMLVGAGVDTGDGTGVGLGVGSEVVGDGDGDGVDVPDSMGVGDGVGIGVGSEVVGNGDGDGVDSEVVRGVVEAGPEVVSGVGPEETGEEAGAAVGVGCVGNPG